MAEQAPKRDVVDVVDHLVQRVIDQQVTINQQRAQLDVYEQFERLIRDDPEGFVITLLARHPVFWKWMSVRDIDDDGTPEERVIH